MTITISSQLVFMRTTMFKPICEISITFHLITVLGHLNSEDIYLYFY